MNRRLLSALALAAPLALAACSPTSTGAGSTGTSAKAGTTTTEKKVETPQCAAVSGFELSMLIAKRDESRQPDKRVGVVAGLDKSAANLKVLVPGVGKDVDTTVAYLKKIVAGTPTTAEEEAAAEKAKSSIHFYRTNKCNSK